MSDNLENYLAAFELLKMELTKSANKVKTKKRPKKKKGPVVLPKENSPTESLYRFLLTGNPTGLYYAGVLNPKKCYVEKNTSFIKTFVKDEETIKPFLEALRLVKKTFDRDMETCHHALVVAIKNTEDEKVKNALYNEAINMADTCESFFSLLHQMREQKIGSPSGWRRFVTLWYKSIPPTKLAEMVSNVKGRHGWSHKDVITLAHGWKPAETDSGLKVITKYIFEGLVGATKEFGEDPSAKEILDILKKYEQASQCEDSELLASLVDENQNIGCHMILYESKNARRNTPGVVWKSLLKKMSADELLNCIQIMHNHLALIDYTGMEASGNAEMNSLLQLLKRNEYKQHDVTDDLVKALGNIVHASPTLAYITFRNYEEGRRRLPPARLPFYNKTKKDKMTFTAAAASSEVSRKRWPKLSRKGELVPPSRPVSEALNALVQRSLANQPADKKIPGKYMVTIDARSHMFKVYQSVRKAELAKKNIEAEKNTDKTEPSSNNTTIPAVKVYDDGKNHCFWAEHVSPGKAGVLLALYFVSHVQDVTVAVFTDSGVEEVSLVKQDGQLLTMKEAEDKLTASNLGNVSLCSPIQWAKENKIKYDLFINILRTSAVTMKIPKQSRSNASNPCKILYDYQKDLEIPHSGLVNISLGKFSRLRTDYNQRRILDICGFDEHITELIHTFASENYRDKI